MYARQTGELWYAESVVKFTNKIKKHCKNISINFGTGKTTSRMSLRNYPEKISSRSFLVLRCKWIPLSSSDCETKVFVDIAMQR